MKKACLAAVFGLTLSAAAAQAEPCCQPKPLADADLDGDGRAPVMPGCTSPGMGEGRS